MLFGSTTAAVLLVLLQYRNQTFVGAARNDESSVCHAEMREEFQCYSNLPPFDNTRGHLPASPSEQDITLRLYTHNNVKTPEFVDPSQPSTLTNSNFNFSHETKFIVHGFTSSAEAEWMLGIKDALLANDTNVILVDWSTGAKGPNYYQATANTRVVGAHIASLVLVADEYGAPPSKSHVIGHSLGAQVGGYAGSALNGRLGRVSGLDPAGPLFDGYDQAVKLDRSDAQFVDVIHTDAKPTRKGGLGSTEINGHVDFFPNGGFDMPGCGEEVEADRFDGHTVDVLCSHNRAREYYLASIHDNEFKAYPCPEADRANPERCTQCGSGCTSMGYHATSEFSGVFVLTTGENYPY